MFVLPQHDRHQLPACSGSPQSLIPLIPALYLPLLCFHFFTQSQSWDFSSPRPSSVFHPPILSPITVHIFNIDSISLFSFSLALSAFERADNWGMSLTDRYLLLTRNISPNGWMGKVMLRLKTGRYGGIPNRRETEGVVYSVESDTE